MTNSTTSRVCGYCGIPVERKGSRGPLPKYCNEDHKWLARMKRERDTGMWDENLAKLREKTKKRQEENARPCPYCGTLMTNPRRKQCGARACKLKFNSVRQGPYSYRYAVEPGQPRIDRFAIFDRDRWICQICKTPVPLVAIFPHPQSPSLDHFIPFSKDGPNIPENLRLAHLRCNSARGNRYSVPPKVR